MPNTGYQIFQNRLRLVIINGITQSGPGWDYTEPNNVGGIPVLSGLGPYIPPILNYADCPLPITINYVQTEQATPWVDTDLLINTILVESGSGSGLESVPGGSIVTIQQNSGESYLVPSYFFLSVYNNTTSTYVYNNTVTWSTPGTYTYQTIQSTSFTASPGNYTITAESYTNRYIVQMCSGGYPSGTSGPTYIINAIDITPSIGSYYKLNATTVSVDMNGVNCWEVISTTLSTAAGDGTFGSGYGDCNCIPPTTTTTTSTTSTSTTSTTSTSTTSTTTTLSPTTTTTSTTSTSTTSTTTTAAPTTTSTTTSTTTDVPTTTTTTTAAPTTSTTTSTTTDIPTTTSTTTTTTTAAPTTTSTTTSTTTDIPTTTTTTTTAAPTTTSTTTTTTTVPVYPFSLYYSATDCNGACYSGTPITVYSTCSSLTSGCYLYIDSGLTTEVSTGYFSDGGTNCYTYTSGSPL